MASPLPADARDRKRVPLVTGCLDYFPAALAEVAKVSLAGNEQHHPGEPLHHERGKSSDHADALARHLEDRGTRDTDGQLHSAKVAWRALALLQEELEAAGAPLARGARLPEAAPTPTSETAAAMRETLAGGLKAHATVASLMADLASVPCAECTKRDANGECSAQCVREESGPAASPAEPEATSAPKDCLSCGHSADDGTGYPCRSCLTEFRRDGSLPNWTPAPPAPPPMRECATCRHTLANSGSCGGPCLDCRNWSHWEPGPAQPSAPAPDYSTRSCVACAYQDVPVDGYPCRGCHMIADRPCWEAKP